MPLEWLFFIDVFTAIFGISILYFFVHITEKQSNEPQKSTLGISYFKDIKEGFAYVYKHKYIWHLVLITIGIHILIAPSAFLTPLQVTRDFGREVWRLMAIEVAFSGGMMLGGVLIGFWGGFKNKVYSMALSGFVTGACTVALGVFGNFWLYLMAFFVLGLFLPLYHTPQMVMLQTKVDNEYMGRVMSVFGMVATLVMPAGMLLFGPLGDIVSIDLLLIISGIMLTLLIFPVLLSKTLRAAGT
jgi:DHA3 family macrolide efflux protein-like MFS transporter